MEKEKTHGGGIPFLKAWKEEGESIAGEWNGDEPKGEDRAMCGKEIMEKCEELLKGHQELQDLIESL